jgi:hypothetical protein
MAPVFSLRPCWRRWDDWRGYGMKLHHIETARIDAKTFAARTFTLKPPQFPTSLLPGRKAAALTF